MSMSVLRTKATIGIQSYKLFFRLDEKYMFSLSMNKIDRLSQVYHRL